MFDKMTSDSHILLNNVPGFNNSRRAVEQISVRLLIKLIFHASLSSLIHNPVTTVFITREHIFLYEAKCYVMLLYFPVK